MSLFWIIFCVVVAYFADQRGRNPVLWGLLALFISPLLAGLALAVMKDMSVEEKIDELDKTTENIKREVKSNQKYNEQERERIQNRLSGAKRSSSVDNQIATTKSVPALEAKKIKCEECGKNVSADTNYCVNCGNRVIEDNKKECPNCQELIDEKAKFCVKCGEKLISECSNCGQEVNSNVKFCMKCGEEIITTEE
ncbi:zinc ribbon domain-containing protein [Halobacteroides halobius]|uniref:zinc ribbon domain-containing protein n=1 Tax=Halobacteroides halobius TaxID=42422 RepID=UPI00031C9718|nr:zinc ribbon domain-containing protein [Halobacteroides halobius]